MKKKFSKISISFIIILLILAKAVLAVDFKFKELEYTDEYKNYLELPEEERSKYIEPRKYKIINEDNNNTNDNYLKNEKISLKNLLTVLRASQKSEQKEFSLKSIISDNIIIKNQMNTNTCLSFATLSGLETNLALKDYYNKTDEQEEVRKYDFSERHMAYSMSQSFKEGNVNKYGYSSKVSDGASLYMGVSYLTNGQGAVNESDMEFQNNEDDISIKDIQNKQVQTTVNDIIFFDSISSSEMVNLTDTQKLEALKKQMKEHISTNGAINVGIYAPTTQEENEKYLKDNKSIFVNEIVTGKGTDGQTVSLPSNHAVSIIGWNDDYSKDEFKATPKNNGAWIVRNSWGEKEEYTFDQLREICKQNEHKENLTEEEFNNYLTDLQELGFTVDRDTEKIYMLIGDNGLYYVSYEDVYIYNSVFGIVSADNKKTYDNLYQYDELGGNNAYTFEALEENKLDLYLANTFHRSTTQPEYLTSIGISNIVEAGTYEVYVNPNGTDKSMSNLQKAKLITGDEITLTAGYNTIRFETPFKLEGKDYVVVLKQKFVEGVRNYFTLESSTMDKNVSSNAGESFITVGAYRSDSDWLDIGAPGNSSGIHGNLCIKGFTANNYDGEVQNDPSKTPVDEDNATNSDFSSAKAELANLKFDTTSASFEFKFVVKNIKVTDICDSYVHYIYLSSSKNKTKDEIDAQGRWVKLSSDSFEKQSDGTYNLNITLNKAEQLVGLNDDETSENLYIYVKEEAVKGTQTSTKYYSPINVAINTGDLGGDDGDVKTPTEDGPKIKKDPTTSTTPLPNTGFKKILIVGIVIIMISSICYIRIKKMKELK